jgi:hypothetical protein
VTRREGKFCRISGGSVRRTFAREFALSTAVNRISRFRPQSALAGSPAQVRSMVLNVPLPARSPDRVPLGRMAERLKATVLKTVWGASPTWVRIPLLPLPTKLSHTPPWGCTSATGTDFINSLVHRPRCEPDQESAEPGAVAKNSLRAGARASSATLWVWP